MSTDLATRINFMSLPIGDFINDFLLIYIFKHIVLSWTKNDNNKRSMFFKHFISTDTFVFMATIWRETFLLTKTSAPDFITNWFCTTDALVAMAAVFWVSLFLAKITTSWFITNWLEPTLTFCHSARFERKVLLSTEIMTPTAILKRTKTLFYKWKRFKLNTKSLQLTLFSADIKQIMAPTTRRSGPRSSNMV